MDLEAEREMEKKKELTLVCKQLGFLKALI